MPLRPTTPSLGSALSSGASSTTSHDAVDDRVGIDAQVSNWALGGDGLLYLDVSTPFLRDAEGHDRFDCDTYLESIPAVFRGFARRFVIPGVVQTYHSTHSIVLNLAGHLTKEGLDDWIPLTLELARERLGVDLSAAAARRHYRNDVRLWGLIQRRASHRPRVATPRAASPVPLLAPAPRRTDRLSVLALPETPASRRQSSRGYRPEP